MSKDCSLLKPRLLLAVRLNSSDSEGDLKIKGMENTAAKLVLNEHFTAVGLNYFYYLHEIYLMSALEYDLI